MENNVAPISADDILRRRGLRPTPARILVLRSIMQADTPVSLVELETQLETLERSSIFRTLVRMAQCDILHTIDDGTGSTKYELCKGGDHHTPEDLHCHFHCTECGKTYCLENTRIPRVNLPPGFESVAASHIVKGVCPDCH